MYFENYLSLIEKISQDKGMTKENKSKIINEAKEEMIQIINFMDYVIDTKLGHSQFETQEEYDKMIDATIVSAKTLNVTYKDWMKNELFDANVLNASKMYDISSEIHREIRERTLKKEGNMYFEKFLNYANVVSKRQDITQEKKEAMLEEMKNEFLKVVDASNIILDAKLGTSDYKNKEEYNNAINESIVAAKKADNIYKAQFGVEMFKKAPESAAEVYDISAQISKDMLRKVEEEND